MNKQQLENLVQKYESNNIIKGKDYNIVNDGKGNYDILFTEQKNSSPASAEQKEQEQSFSEAHPYLNASLKYAPDVVSLLPYLIAPEVAIPARLGSAAAKYLPRIWNTIKLAGASGAVAGLTQKGINTAEETAGYKPTKNAGDNFLETTAFNLATPAVISAAKGIGGGVARGLGLGSINEKLAQAAINNLENKTAEEGGLALTPSQVQNSPRLATLEQNARTGKYGEQTQNIIRNLDNLQERSVANNFKEVANLPLEEEIDGQSINSRVNNIYNAYKNAVEGKEAEYKKLYDDATPELSKASIGIGMLSRIRDKALNPSGYNQDAINQILLGKNNSIDKEVITKIANTLGPTGVSNIDGIRNLYSYLNRSYTDALKQNNSTAAYNINAMSKALREETSKVIQEHPNISPETKNAMAFADDLYKTHKIKINGSEIYKTLKTKKTPESIAELLMHEDPTTSSKAIQDFNKFVDKNHDAFTDLQRLHLLNHGTKVENGKYIINAENLVNNLSKNRGGSVANALFSEEEQKELDNFADNVSQTLRQQLPYKEQSIGSSLLHAAPLPSSVSKIASVINPFNKSNERNTLLNAINELGENTQSSGFKIPKLIQAALAGARNNLTKEVVLNQLQNKDKQ